MTPHRAAVTATLLAGLALATVPVGASDPVGIYCVVKKVVFEPNDTEPARVQIWGAFSMSRTPLAVEGGGGAGYTDVMTGYLYYFVRADTNAAVIQHNKIVTNEWMDLKTVAGTNEVVGFAGRRRPLGRVRPAGEAPRDPDPYPTQNIGVIRMRDNTWAQATWYADMAAALRKAAAGR
jgi:hypothetical protein